ncbi:MAG: autotransporter domain-containing protein [Fusobacterium ulcerans]|uniref:autotransporter family protein n=1 Tax=Fusobacterium ulcerans TaxID=861 RepID=UPI003A89D552
MIEKIMKTVKSGNKKRGRNITIGAVVGMLLSCTVAMGADVSGLEITQDTDGIKFSKDYTENTWDEESKTYTNNTTISGINADGIGSGINVNATGVNIVNKGIISGTAGGSSISGYGIKILSSSTVKDITNTGLIIGVGSEPYGSSYGILNNGTITGTIKNNGLITGTKAGQIGYGIINSSGSIERLVNNGLLTGDGSNAGATVISNINSGNIEELINTGLITTKKGTGIQNSSYSGITNLTNSGAIHGTFNGITNTSQGVITTLVNSGVISGDRNAINNETYSSIKNMLNTGAIYGKASAIKNTGTMNEANNYGLLLSNTGDTVSGVTALIDSNNLGLIFKEVSGKYTATENDFKKFGQVSEDGGYKIINANAKNNNKEDIEGTESLTLENGKLLYKDSADNNKVEKIDLNKKYILNGITDTLLVSTGKNILNDSVINAYKTAVVMNGENLYLELNDTTVNGGIDGTSSVISVTGDNNFLTVSGDSIVNGKMSATGEKNTLNLYGKQNMTKSNDNENMNILNDIEGFGRIQIENNVTFFEDVKVTGVDRININNGGTLSLRLKAGEAPNTKATHALNDHADGANDSTLLIAGKEEGGSETAGTLNFITNGMGTGTVIDMEGIELENVYLRANSILYDLEVVDTEEVGVAAVGDIKLEVGASLADIYNERAITFDPYPKYSSIPDEVLYNSLNKIYQSSIGRDNNVDAVTGMIASSSDEEQWRKLLSFLGGIYTESPYSYSSELSRRSVGMFRDIVAENEFRPNQDKWLIMGGLTHADGGTKDTYYGKNYYEIDGGTSDISADMKLTGAYMLAKYGYSENISLGLTLGGNKSEAEMSMSKVKGNSGYLGAFAENYRGNLTLKAGAGVQYSEYDADRSTLGGRSYSDKYSDMTYDIYLNGRYSHQVGDNLFLEPYATLSYTYVDQDGANEGSKALAIETDSKSFDYTVGKVGVDLKKVIPHEKGKSTLSAGVSYTKILDGAEEEHITGRFKGGSDFDILVAHKNEHSIGLNAKYALELENGVIFDVKGTYSVERDSHNGSGKNRTKSEWIVGAGIGYKF